MEQEGEGKVEATAQEPAGTEPGEAPAAGVPQVRRQVTRSRSNRMFAGVAGGLGEYFAVDPILFRLAFAFLALLGGAGVAMYLAAWLLIPEEGERTSVGEVAVAKASSYVSRDDNSWIWIAALVIGGLMVVSFGFGHDGSPWFPAILLIAGGIWLYRQDANVAAAPPAGDYPATQSGAASSSATASVGPSAAYATPRPSVARPVVPRPPESLLGRYVFAATLVALGVVAMLDNSGVLAVEGSEYAAVALTAIGAGLVVGSVMGRARGLIFWGLLLTPFVLLGPRLNVPLGGGVGERSYYPVTAEELAGDYDMFAGELTFDLSGMEWDSEPAELDANLFMGKIEVLVPEGVEVQFNGSAEMGSLELFDQGREGTSVTMFTTQGPAGGPRLVLDADVFMGEVSVIRTVNPAKELS